MIIHLYYVVNWLFDFRNALNDQTMIKLQDSYILLGFKLNVIDQNDINEKYISTIIV